MLYGPSVRSRSAPQDAPSSHCYQGLFGCPDFESANGSSGWCSCSHNVARIRAAWCPLRPARSLRLRPSAGGGTWPWSRAACGRCGDALLVAAGRGSLATEELGGDVARHAADSLPSSTWLTQGHPRLGPGRPVRCARQAPERAGEAKRRPIPARLRLRPDQGGGRVAGEQTEQGQAALWDRGFHQPPGHHGHKHATVEYVRGVCLGPAGDLRRLGFPEDNGCRQVGDRRRDLIRVAIYVFAALL